VRATGPPVPTITCWLSLPGCLLLVAAQFPPHACVRVRVARVPRSQISYEQFKMVACGANVVAPDELPTIQVQYWPYVKAQLSVPISTVTDWPGVR